VLKVEIVGWAISLGGACDSLVGLGLCSAGCFLQPSWDTLSLGQKPKPCSLKSGIRYGWRNDWFPLLEQRAIL